jgi:DNA-binding MarR family transcriptional regulator
MPSERENDLSELILVFFYAYRRFIETPDKWLAEVGLGRVHHRLMFTVAHNPGCSVGELLAVLGVTKQAVHAPLRDLVRGGWVSSTPGETDRRQKCLRLTEKGAALESQLSGHQRDRLAAAFLDVGPEGEQIWRRVMTLLGRRVSPSE